MHAITRNLRFIYIYYVFMKYGLDRALFRLPLLKTFKFIVWLNPFYWRLKKLNLSRGERLTLALESLGPLFIKFGQILSTRYDVVPEDIIKNLNKLQDQVKPFDATLAKAMIEKALNASITELFIEFDDTPLASASISQVHTARLPSGEEVIIKVLRPNIHNEINQDLSLLKFGAHMLESISKTLRRLNLSSSVNELERTLTDELDLIKEAANASQLKRNFKDRQGLYIPKVYWDYCRKNILVMERIRGIPILNKSTLTELGFNLHKVAEQGLILFYTQVFQDSFFHADLHPGNLFINPQDTKNIEWMLVDFGIVSTLSKENQHYLAANFLAFIDRNYRRVAELHLESGWIPPNIRVDIIESAVRSVCEPIFESPREKISMGETLLRLLMIAREFNMEVMPELLLLQKSLINIEGVAKYLDPRIDIWQIAHPILKRWMKQQAGIRGLFKALREQMPTLIDRLPEIPGLLYQVLKQRANPTPKAPELKANLGSKSIPWMILIIGILVGMNLHLYLH